MEMSSQSLSLQQAADAMSVHYMTMYRYVRLGLLPAVKSGGVWRVSAADLNEFSESPQVPAARGEAPWAQRLEDRMVAGDLTGAWSVVESALASGTSPARIYVDVLAPALTSIGNRWSQGELDVSDEHLASVIAARIIGQLGMRFNRRGRRRGSVATAMPSGERHGFGLAMLADVLRGEGYSVVDLGPDTPVEALVAKVASLDDLKAVCLSVAHDAALPALAEMVFLARSSLPTDIPLLVGGRAIVSIDHATSLGADGWAVDPTEVTNLIQSFGRRS